MKKIMLLLIGLLVLSSIASAEVYRRQVWSGASWSDGVRSGQDIVEKRTGTRERFRGGRLRWISGSFIKPPGNTPRVGAKYYRGSAAERPSQTITGSLGTYVKILNRSGPEDVDDRATRAYSWDGTTANFIKVRKKFRQSAWRRR